MHQRDWEHDPRDNSNIRKREREALALEEEEVSPREHFMIKEDKTTIIRDLRIEKTEQIEETGMGKEHMARGMTEGTAQGP